MKVALDDDEEEEEDNDEVGDALVEDILRAVRVALRGMDVTVPQLLSSATETVELLLLQAALKEAVQRVAQKSQQLFG